MIEQFKWNLRIVRFEMDERPRYRLCEVFYTEDGSIRSINPESVWFQHHTWHSLKLWIEYAAIALNYPVLDFHTYEELPVGICVGDELEYGLPIDSDPLFYQPESPLNSIFSLCEVREVEREKFDPINNDGV